MNKNYPTSLAKQKGIAFWHIMLLVGIAVTLALCAKKGTVPFFQTEAPVVGKMDLPKLPSLSFPKFSGGDTSSSSAQTTEYYQPEEIHTRTPVQTSVTHVSHTSESLMTNNKTTHVTQPPRGTSYEVEYPRDLASGYYTVQVFSGYNSKSAYDLQKALKRDGYRSYIHSEETGQGILFKVRIGKYTNRSDAFAMNSKIRVSYPKKMGKSFVLLRQ